MVLEEVYTILVFLQTFFNTQYLPNAGKGAEMEEWIEIWNFPGYSVSSHGRFRNDRFGRIMTLSPNQSGIMTVGMMRDGVQCRRSAKRIAAFAFCEQMGEDADVPVLLDGDENNLRADNIVWRPKWFASTYAWQWRMPRPWFKVGPIGDRQGNEWGSVEECARSIGALCIHILLSAHNGSWVYPSGEVMHFVR
jgi:NUMOD4 motif